MEPGLGADVDKPKLIPQSILHPPFSKNAVQLTFPSDGDRKTLEARPLRTGKLQRGGGVWGPNRG